MLQMYSPAYSNLSLGRFHRLAQLYLCCVFDAAIFSSRARGGKNHSQWLRGGRCFCPGLIFYSASGVINVIVIQYGLLAWQPHSSGALLAPESSRSTQLGSWIHCTSVILVFFSIRWGTVDQLWRSWRRMKFGCDLLHLIHQSE